jgi:hypothetical protein
MASGNLRSRPIWFWPLVAFLVGLLVGWLVIGWGLWPVTWKNTLPRDLRPTERDAYLVMVAESLETTGDTAIAQERLASWPPDALAADLARLQGRFSGSDAAQAGRVQALASALSANQGAATQGQTAGSQAPGGGSLFSGLSWRTVCTTGLWVLLVLLGAVVVALLYRRWRASQMREAAPAITPTADDEHVWSQVGGRTTTDSAQDTYGTWTEGGVEGETSSRASAPPWEEQESVSAGEEEFMPPPRRTAPQPVDQSARPAAAVSSAAAGASRPIGAAVPSGALTKVTEVRALYQMGEPDYDEAFDVKDSSGAYIGECGVALVDPVGRGHDQAAALQVWLWDKTDPDTKVKVLMGEGAYRDTALRDQLAKDHPSTSVKPGAAFELDSYNLLLRGTVEKLDYAELEPAYGVFAELQLLLQVFRKG